MYFDLYTLCKFLMLPGIYEFSELFFQLSIFCVYFSFVACIVCVCDCFNYENKVVFSKNYQLFQFEA